MRVVITGGSGLIGRALAAEMLASGSDVTVVSRDPRRLGELPERLRVAAWDARSIDPLLPMLASADAVVHLVGESLSAGRWTKSRKRRILESRLASGAALAAAIARAPQPPPVLVQASAVGYYGPRGDELVTEEAPRGDDYLARVAGQWEASTASVESLGVRRVVVRTGLVLARGGGALGRMLPVYRLGIAGPLAGGRQWWPWIHIADEAAAIRFLLETSDASGPYNLTAPRPVTNAEFTAALGRALRRPAKMPVPAVALKLAFGEMSTVLISGQRAVPRRLVGSGFAFKFAEIQPALEDLLAPEA